MKARLLVRFIIIGLFLAPMCLWSEYEIGGERTTNDGKTITEDVGNLNLPSPDRKLVLRHRKIRGKGDRKNDHESRINILDATGNTLGSLDLTSEDSEHGRVIERIGWSSDSRFVVFSSYSSGGHSPWNSMTFFYSVDLNCFGVLDNFLPGPVLDPNFELAASSEVRLVTMGKDMDDQVKTKFDLRDIVTGKAKVRNGLSKWLKSTPRGECGF
jgi:hypothetical protein